MDCAHGATYKVAPSVLSELGAEIKLVGAKPNGMNINAGVGSLHPEKLVRLVKAGHADLGVAFDGDGDRLIMVDDKGELIDGDKIMAICADQMMKENLLERATVAATVMSNLGLEICLRERGVKLVRTRVGDRYVVESMRKEGFNLGGEQSGHLIFLDHNTTGDGILSALMVLKVMVTTGKPLSELALIMPRIPQTLVNLRIAERKPLAEAPTLQRVIHDEEKALGANGRVLVRFSGTEPLLRIMVEATEQSAMENAAQRLSQAAEQDFGAA